MISGEPISDIPISGAPDTGLLVVLVAEFLGSTGLRAYFEGSVGLEQYLSGETGLRVYSV